MGRVFTGSQYFQWDGGPNFTEYPFYIAAWVRPSRYDWQGRIVSLGDVDSQDYELNCNVADVAAAPQKLRAAIKTIDDPVNGIAEYDLPENYLDTWRHVWAIFFDEKTRFIRWGPTSVADPSLIFHGWPTAGKLDQVRIGVRSRSGAPSGHLTHCAVAWVSLYRGRYLTEDELLSASSGVHPLRLGPNYCWPLNAINATDDEYCHVTGEKMTVVGSPAPSATDPEISPYTAPAQHFGVSFTEDAVVHTIGPVAVEVAPQLLSKQVDRPIGPVTVEVDPQAVAKSVDRTVGPVTVEAQPVPAARTVRRAIGPVTVEVEPQPLTMAGVRILGPVVVEVAPVALAKSLARTVGPVTVEADPRAMSRSIVYRLGPVEVVVDPQALIVGGSRILGPVVVHVSPVPLDRLSGRVIGPVAVEASPQPMTPTVGRTIGPVTVVVAPQSLHATIRRAMGPTVVLVDPKSIESTAGLGDDGEVIDGVLRITLDVDQVLHIVQTVDAVLER